jgi:hypothetical protein
MCDWQRAIFVWRNTHLMHTPQWIQFCAALLLRPHTLHGSHWPQYFYTPIRHNKIRHLFECFFLFHQVTISTFYALKYHRSKRFLRKLSIPCFFPAARSTTLYGGIPCHSGEHRKLHRPGSTVSPNYVVLIGIPHCTSQSHPQNDSCAERCITGAQFGLAVSVLGSIISRLLVNAVAPLQDMKCTKSCC